MKISVLTLARKRSRFLSHFIFNFLNTTADYKNTELLVMASANDDWNEDLFKFFATRPKYPIKFFFEDRKLGKYGRHLFFNELAQSASGDWLLHTCDDQIFIHQGWDNYIRSMIRTKGITPDKAHMIIPSFDNTGDVDQMVSRGFVNILGRIGGYGNIDSWLNEVREVMPADRVHKTPDNLMRDLTVYPEIFTPEYQTADTSEGDKLPKWESTEVMTDLELERQKIKEAIQNGL